MLRDFLRVRSVLFVIIAIIAIIVIIVYILPVISCLRYLLQRADFDKHHASLHSYVCDSKYAKQVESLRIDFEKFLAVRSVCPLRGLPTPWCYCFDLVCRLASGRFAFPAFSEFGWPHSGPCVCLSASRLVWAS